MTDRAIRLVTSVCPAHPAPSVILVSASLVEEFAKSFMVWSVATMIAGRVYSLNYSDGFYEVLIQVVDKRLLSHVEPL